MLLYPNYYNTLMSFYNNPDMEKELTSQQISLVQTREEFSHLQIKDNIAVITIRGLIVERASFWSMIFGFTACDTLVNDLKKVRENKAVDILILDVDSPGGTPDGLQNVSDMIFNMRSEKQTIGIINSMACSAAYWLITSCEKVGLISETATVGSVGVALTHIDISEFLREKGLRITHIVAGKYKRLGAEEIPLDEESTRLIKEDVDKMYDIFTSNLARNLSMSQEDIIVNMGDGRAFFGEEARKRKMVHGMIEFDKVIGVIDMGQEFNIFKLQDQTDDKDKDIQEEEENEEEMIDEGETPEDDDTETQEEEEEDEELQEEEEEEETVKKKDVSAVQQGIRLERKRVLALMQEGLPDNILLKSIKKGMTVQEAGYEAFKAGSTSTMKTRKNGKYKHLLNDGVTVKTSTGRKKTKKKSAQSTEKRQEQSLDFIKSGSSRFKVNHQGRQRELSKMKMPYEEKE